MADSGSSNTGVVAVLVIFIIVAVGAFFAWKGGMFGGGGGGTEVEVKIEAPPAPAKPDN